MQRCSMRQHLCTGRKFHHSISLILLTLTQGTCSNSHQCERGRVLGRVAFLITTRQDKAATPSNHSIRRPARPEMGATPHLGCASTLIRLAVRCQAFGVPTTAPRWTSKAASRSQRVTTSLNINRCLCSQRCQPVMPWQNSERSKLASHSCLATNQSNLATKQLHSFE